MATTHFLSWRPYHVTLSNLLDTVYLHTVHDTHALQITVTICSHSTDDALHIFYADTVTKRAIFSQALTLAS